MGLALATAEQVQRRTAARARVPPMRAAVAATVVLTAGAGVLGATAETQDPVSVAGVRALLVAAPMAAGLYAAQTRQHERFARLLYASGVLAFCATLAELPDPALYTAGHASAWALEVLVAVLLLAYPNGHLDRPVDRRLAGAMVAAVGVFFVPQLLVAGQFLLPSPYTSCTDGGHCPANALLVLDHGWAGVGTLQLLGVVAVFGVMVAIAMRVQQRVATAAPALRAALVPVLAVAMARPTLLGIGILARELGDHEQTVQAVAWLLALSIPALGLAVLLSLLQERVHSEKALGHLAAVVHEVPEPAALQRALGEALGDPRTELLFPDERRADGWIDHAGRRVSLPHDDPARSVFVVYDHHVPAAAIVNPADHVVDPELRSAAVAIAAVALDNHRLVARSEAIDLELRRSRARLAVAADAERRRLERDLHDGAQQRLVALRVELGLLEDVAQCHPEQVAQRVQALERSAEEALDELRALAHGVCPPLLTDGGLVDALSAAARRCRTPVTFRAHHVGRYAPEIETAVYFCVLEALQNIDKHAAGSLHAGLELDGRGPSELRFVVHDRGPGIPSSVLHGGSGLLNMRDRIAAVGGQVRIASSPRLGTTVRGWVPATAPLAPPQPPPPAGDRGPATGRAAS